MIIKYSMLSILCISTYVSVHIVSDRTITNNGINRLLYAHRYPHIYRYNDHIDMDSILRDI